LRYFQVFVRELISNASDALEKLRYLTMLGESVRDKDAPLEIHIAVDDNKKTLTIQVNLVNSS
jgi:HSP90 family molecular chaperone